MKQELVFLPLFGFAWRDEWKHCIHLHLADVTADISVKVLAAAGGQRTSFASTGMLQFQEVWVFPEHKNLLGTGTGSPTGES